MVPGASFHLFCHNEPKKWSKIGRVPIDPVQMEENGDHHRISHGLKPVEILRF